MSAALFDRQNTPIEREINDKGFGAVLYEILIAMDSSAVDHRRWKHVRRSLADAVCDAQTLDAEERERIEAIK